MKTKKREMVKRVAMGMLAGVMLFGSSGTASAAEKTAADYWNAGKEAYEKGFYYKANELQDKAYELSDNAANFAAVYEQKIRSMYAAGKYWYVEQYYEEAVKLGIVNAYMTSYYGDALMSCKQYDKAIEMFQQVIDRYANGDPLYIANYIHAIGDCLKKLGRTAEAVAAYEEAHSLDGDDEKFQKKMRALELEWELNDVQTVVSNYMDGMTNEEIADILAEYEYYDEALQFYEKAENEEGVDMRTSIAYTYNSKGLPKEAASLYEAYLLENPEDTAALNMLGAIYCDELGRYDEAAELFNQVVALNPKANATKSNLAVVARKKGNYEELPAIYESVRQMDDTYVAAYNHKISYQKNITAEQAIQELSRYPGWPESAEMQALMLNATIDTDFMTASTLESYLEYYKERLAEDSSNYYYLSTIASLLCGLGKYEEAYSYYVQAKDVAGVLTYYATNGLGNCYYYMQNYDLAAEQYEENMSKVSDRGSILNVAECRIAAGEFEQARADIERYVSEGGLDDVSYYHMLLAYQEEDYVALLSYTDQYLEEVPDSLKGKAYKVAALNALGREGAEEILADINSISYPYEKSEVLIAESILGRFDKAREVYQFLLDYYPKTAREVVDDYELSNLRKDPEFCMMAGIEVPVVVLETPQENTGTEAGEEKNPTEGNLAGEQTVAENVTEAEADLAINPIPVAVGVGIVAALAGTVAVLVRKRTKTK